MTIDEAIEQAQAGKMLTHPALPREAVLIWENGLRVHFLNGMASYAFTPETNYQSPDWRVKEGWLNYGV